MRRTIKQLPLSVVEAKKACDLATNKRLFEEKKIENAGLAVNNLKKEIETLAKQRDEDKEMTARVNAAYEKCIDRLVRAENKEKALLSKIRASERLLSENEDKSNDLILNALKEVEKIAKQSVLDFDKSKEKKDKLDADVESRERDVELLDKLIGSKSSAAIVAEAKLSSIENEIENKGKELAGIKSEIELIDGKQSMKEQLEDDLRKLFGYIAIKQSELDKKSLEFERYELAMNKKLATLLAKEEEITLKTQQDKKLLDAIEVKINRSKREKEDKAVNDLLTKI